MKTNEGKEEGRGQRDEGWVGWSKALHGGVIWLA